MAWGRRGQSEYVGQDWVEMLAMIYCTAIANTFCQ